MTAASSSASRADCVDSIDVFHASDACLKASSLLRGGRDGASTTGGEAGGSASGLPVLRYSDWAWAWSEAVLAALVSSSQRKCSGAGVCKISVNSFRLMPYSFLIICSAVTPPASMPLSLIASKSFGDSLRTSSRASGLTPSWSASDKRMRWS